MPPTREQLLEALRRVPYPGFRKDIVAAGAVTDVAIDDTGTVRFALAVGAADAAVARKLEQAARDALAGLDGVSRVEIRVAGATSGSPALRMAGGKPSVAAAGALDTNLMPGVRKVIAVASGKGGVGKSTMAVNLAIALARGGLRVGLLDADIYGPSIPLMTGITEQPQLTPERKLIPFERFGLRIMSLGFLIEPGSAVIWRGPMVMKALEQLLGDTVWGELDLLVVDMPPGTGDAQLTLSQKVRLAGAVIVTTPQDVALADAVKGVAMFRKVDVPVLGIVENMSYFLCPHCDGRSEIFSSGGGRAEAARQGVPLLGEIPLHADIRSGGDLGEPVVSAAPDSPQAQAFLEVARRVREALDPDDDAVEAPERGSIFERFRKVWPGKTD